MTAPLYTEKINVREGMQEEERVRRMFNKRIREVTYLKGLDDEKEARREREVSLEASHRTRWGKEETVQEVSIFNIIIRIGLYRISGFFISV